MSRFARRLEVTGALLRELVRTFATPLYLLGYLLRQRAWKERTRAAVCEQRPEDATDPFAHALEVSDALRAHRPPRPAEGRRRHVFLSAGEASGVAHARRLAIAIVRLCEQAGEPPPRFSVFGDDELAECVPDGTLVYPLADHPQVGISGVLSNIGFFVRAHATFVDLLEDDRPDLVVLVDYPGLHLVMARAAQRRRVPVVHYVAPQYWAWGPWRIDRYRRAMDATLTILPFEATFFTGVGLPSAYVGHPLIDAFADDEIDTATLTEAKSRPTLVLLPGSRRNELAWHLRGMLEVGATALSGDRPRCVVPQRDPNAAARTRAALAELPDELTAGVEVVDGDPRPWMQGARAILAKSGTASLEACLQATPTVIVYRVADAFYRFIYHNVFTAPFFGAANLAAGREVAREMIIIDPEKDWQEAGRALAAIWIDGPDRDAAFAGLEEVRRRLGAPGASERAARVILPWCTTGESGADPIAVKGTAGTEGSAVRSP